MDSPAVARDPALAKARFLDARLPVDKRVADLLARMTLEEKIAQLHGTWRPRNGVLVDAELKFAPGNDKARALLANGIGQISRASENEDARKNLGPRAMAEFTNAIQRHLIAETRLGIPMINHEEGLHGLQAPGATSFPQPIALAASFDPELVEEVMSAVAREARARGAQHLLAPVVDVMRDPRWGRAEETYGEDPYLVSRMGVAAVRGLQGRGPRIDSRHVAATLKHLAVHGQSEGGINVGPGNHSERLIREVFLPPFAAAIKEANAARRDARVRRDRRRPGARQRLAAARRPARRMEVGRTGRVRLLRAGAAQDRSPGDATATPPRRARRWRPASTSSCPTRSCTRCSPAW